MKISLNWLRQFTDIDLSIDELVKKIGAQLGAVEEVVYLGKKYQRIIVAEVVSCEKHPNADKLSVCKINDDGKVQDVERDENGYVQVVCGAPNVRKGLKVAWLPPGATLPSTVDKDPFVLGVRELRSVVSNGMLASAAELSISDDHHGILELEADATLGADFSEAYQLNDHIIDIENKMFTHRPDCFGILGVAREVAGIQSKKFTSPEWYLSGELETGDGPVHVDVQTDLVPRFMAVRVNNVSVGPSPLWLQIELARVGLKSINNIVDITNYLSYVTAQPLHAYDVDKLPVANNLGARKSRKGDKLLLLNGKELELQDDTTVLITSGDVPVGVGGVMGGKDTEVDAGTKNIIIECASFDMYNIRRTSMKYGLFTDAVTRFNKGQSSLQNMAVIARAVEMTTELAGGQQHGAVTDAHNGLPSAAMVRVSSEFINARLGLQLTNQQIADLLENVEFSVALDDELHIVAPFWRTDINIAEDIVEEVGRLYGFDRLRIELPKRSIAPAPRDTALQLKSQIRDVLIKAGANEVLTYSFVHGNLLKNVGQTTDQAFELSNALSPDLQYYRTSLTPNLLDKVHGNIKSGFGEFALFEIGKFHIKGKQDKNEPDVPMEFNALSLIFAADEKTVKNYQGAVYYQAKRYLNELLTKFGVLGVTYQSLDSVDLEDNSAIAITAKPFEPSRSAIVYDKKNRALGVVGEYHQHARKSLKLPNYSAGFEVGLGLFMEEESSVYKELSRYPSISQDISLRVARDVSYGAVENELQTGLAELTDEQLNTELSSTDIYQKDDVKHMTFRLTAAHYQRTLIAAEINGLLDKLAERVKQKLNTERI